MKVIVTEYLNVRVGQPSVNAPCYQYLAPGSEIEVDGNLHKGDLFEGKDTWMKDLAGNYYWSGGLSEKMPPPPKQVPAEEGWAIKLFWIEELWAHSKGKHIKVAVLDSGLRNNLSGLSDRPGVSYFNAYSRSIQKEACIDKQSHGTECAAILCSTDRTLRGVAPEIDLLVIKVTDDSGQKTTKAILDGLTRAVELEADVISISFYIAQDENFQKIHEKIKEAYKKNMTIIAAAGNSGGVSFPVNNFPASFPECLSIGGISGNRVRSIYSTKSDFLDLMGPGENFDSVCYPGQKLNGTSYATPFVAGIVALLKGLVADPKKDLTNDVLFEILKKSADRDFEGYNTMDYGSGIVDPLASMKLIKKI